MGIVAIIPARGGSKRIPKKNIRLFAGQPIIAYSINAAKKTGIFNRIIVSTDSEEIAEVAKSFGAEVPFMRPAKLADGFTGTAPVLLHALNWLTEHNFHVDYFCCIYATAPFVRAEYIQKGFDTLREKNVAVAFSVTTFSYPIFRALRITNDGHIEMVWPEYHDSRSQDLPESYHDAGQFYWGNVKRFLKEKILFSKDAVPVILPRYLVQDIDSLEDWETAEKMYLSLQVN
jgi:pseudaminic acid cytidylyltransferase